MKKYKKNLRSQSSQILMKQKKVEDKKVDLEKVFFEYYKDLDDKDDIGINPLPCPAYVNFDASNVATPRIKYSPAFNPALLRRLGECKWKPSY